MEEKTTLAKRLRAAGMDMGEVCEVTGLPQEIVERLGVVEAPMLPMLLG
ncbi:MAG: hypothetical protein ACRCYZ_06405 [Alphaproteobacteria bacterium]